MYSTCIFCNGPLGRNESIEQFPVGRRLAYDPAKGRLWVVCPRCERWNLTPLETRWEAIEEAERAYRAVRLRVSTDNIGLARLKEGLELVRIGTPMRPEIAAWRYGDQFGRRRRRAVAWATLGGVALATQLIAPWTGLFGIGVSAGLLKSGYDWLDRWRGKHIPRLSVQGALGETIWLTRSNARCALLWPAVADVVGPGWMLRLPYSSAVAPTGPVLGTFGVPLSAKPINWGVTLEGDVALGALGAMLPLLNHAGASTRLVNEAVELVSGTPDAERLIGMASVNTESKKTHVWADQGNVSALPARIRLALEMLLHEDDERRAMEGELHLLELRWRDAEAIANIADSLTLPPDIEAHVDELRSRAGTPDEH